MTQLYVPRYDSLPRFTQFHRFFLKTTRRGEHRSKVITFKN
jgi:hypothetical protein